MFKAVLWVALGLMLACLLCFGGYLAGAGVERARYNAELTRIAADGERDRAELAGALEDAQGRIDTIGIGLAEAVGLASKAPDRNRRIAILVDAIDRAIASIYGGSQDSP